MTSQSTFDIPVNGHATKPAGSNGRGGIPPAPTLPPPKRRRRPLLIAAGVLLVVLGALGAYALASSGSQRIGVIGLAADVPWGQQITAADLTEVQIVADPGLRPIRWTDEATVVGHRAAADLHAGGLLTDADVMTGQQVPPPGEALVGVAAKPGLLPATSLAPGERVLLVPTGQPEPDSSKQPAPVAGTVFTVGAAATTGARTVDVLIDQTSAADVASWSAAGTVALVLVAGK